MATVLHRITKQLIASANTPDYPATEWIINPDLSAVAGVPSKYWRITGDTVATVADTDAIDDDDLQSEIVAGGEPTSEFGDGSDGDMVIIANTQLSRDVYPNTLVVQAGVVLRTLGFRIIARNGIAIHGTVACNGGDATNAVAGTGVTGATLGSSGAGAPGGNSLTPSAAPSMATDVARPGVGGQGGNGGSNGAGAAGSAGGATVDPDSIKSRPRRIEDVITFSAPDNSVAGGRIFIQSASGGGAGAGNGAGAVGGAGGGGGGIVMLAAPRILIGPAGRVAAMGGKGGNGSGAAAGGGGGGGGGIVVEIFRQLRDRGQHSVAGGRGGNGAGTGVNGADGADGLRLTLNIDNGF